MQLTVVIALVSIPTVLCAPALLPHKNGQTDTTNKGPSDTLELDQTGFNHHQPIITLHNSEPRRGQNEFAAEKNGGPEVKRSERVDVEEPEVEDGDATNNMELADEEVKTVLKTFFRNLKHHPEIVEDILEREGAKLMQGHILEEGGEEEQRAEENQSVPEESEQHPLAEENNTGDLPLDISAFQKPSPQLNKVPKQVEKKAGPFAGPPQFIYKSPMRNTKERDELTARSMNNPANNIPPNNIVVSDDTDTADHADIDNAIPVIQQTGTQEQPADDAEALLTNLSEGGDIDMAELERAEEEYSREHPFMNTLPIFPVEPTNPEESEVDAKEDADVEQVEGASKETEESESSEEDKSSEESQPDEKRSEAEVTSEEDSEENDHDSEESEEKWAETQVVDNPPAHEDESGENQAVGKGSPELRPSPYYYYYNEDDLKDEDDQLNASEEGEEENNGAAEGQEDSDESQLQKISEETDEVPETKEENDAGDSQEESIEEETDDTDAPEEPEDDDVIDNSQPADDTSSEEKDDMIEEAPQTDLVNEQSMDKNEADLLSLFRNAHQRNANRPIAGPPM